LFKKLKLVLQDGSEYPGYSFGCYAEAEGELVFNTGMIGYPETLTDPSYSGQILVLTYPLIGNYGVPPLQRDEFGIPLNFESENIRLRGLIVSDYSFEFSHWNAETSLSDWLKREKVPAIYGLDTRAITRKLRSKGTMLAKIVFEDAKADFSKMIDPNDTNLVEKVTIKAPVEYSRGKKRIVLVDNGTKLNILREFLKRDISVIRLPYNYDFTNVRCDGIVISNGPGNPANYLETIENTRKVLNDSKPILGICLGHQILAIAAGASTYKLKYGHRSQNQPVKEMGTKRILITSQNHGYAVERSSMPEDWREWFTNDNDETIEGLMHISRPVFGVQFHPEASPGPEDSSYIFDIFIRTMQ